jgi:FMNH2-dependent dimethyl sulfone monooxygenase
MNTEFAYWIPNVSGGLVITDWPMNTDWSYEYNKKLAQTADEVGFDYALAQARFFCSYNAEKNSKHSNRLLFPLILIATHRCIH